MSKTQGTICDHKDSLDRLGDSVKVNKHSPFADLPKYALFASSTFWIITVFKISWSVIPTRN